MFVRWVVCRMLAAAASLALLAAPAAAQEEARLTLGLGVFDAFDSDDRTGEARVEYRAARQWWMLHPFGGISVSGEGSVHGYAGLLADIPLGERLVLTPSFAPGVYVEGDGKDLGHWIQFRSQVELAWRFSGGSRLGLAVAHISNAGIGDDNPGTEIVALTWTMPLGLL